MKKLLAPIALLLILGFSACDECYECYDPSRNLVVSECCKSSGIRSSEDCYSTENNCQNINGIWRKVD